MPWDLGLVVRSTIQAMRNNAKTAAITAAELSAKVTARPTVKAVRKATAKIAATASAQITAKITGKNAATAGAQIEPATLSSAQRSELRGRAHHLEPVVMIGDAGLTAAVMAEIDRALNAHELIKIRVHGDDRGARLQMLADICTQAACAPVQNIGKLLIIWRKAPDPLTFGKSDIAIARKLKAIKAKANRAKAVKIKRKMSRSKTDKSAPVKRWYSAGKPRETSGDMRGNADDKAGETPQPEISRARRVTRTAR